MQNTGEKGVLYRELLIMPSYLAGFTQHNPMEINRNYSDVHKLGPLH